MLVCHLGMISMLVQENARANAHSCDIKHRGCGINI